MEASDVKRLKELEDENRRLKQMYADLSLKSQAAFTQSTPAGVECATHFKWVLVNGFYE